MECNGVVVIVVVGKDRARGLLPFKGSNGKAGKSRKQNISVHKKPQFDIRTLQHTLQAIERHWCSVFAGRPGRLPPPRTVCRHPRYQVAQRQQSTNGH